MASAQPVRMIVTKAQRRDEPTRQEIAPPLQRSYTYSSTNIPNHDQYPHSSAPASCTYTPPPQYQEPPISLRPLHLGSKDTKAPLLAHEQYPFQNTEIKEEQQSYLSRRKTPFWRTKKGIVLLVLLSNIIIIAIVLGIIFGSRQNNHHERHQIKTDDSDSSSDNSQGLPGSVSQSNSLPLSSSSSVTLSTSSSSTSSSSTSPPSSGSVSVLPMFTTVPSTLPLFTPVPTQTTGGTSQAGGDGNGAGGQGPGATGSNRPPGRPRAAP